MGVADSWFTDEPKGLKPGPASVWFPEAARTRSKMGPVTPPDIGAFMAPNARREAYADRGKMDPVTEALMSVPRTAADLGAGMAGWMLGGVGAGMNVAKEAVKGGDLKEAWDVPFEGISEQFAEYPKVLPETEMSRGASNIVGNVLHGLISVVDDLGNLSKESRLYKTEHKARGWGGKPYTYGGKVLSKSIEEIAPGIVGPLKWVTELFAFKAAHSTGKVVKEAYNARATRLAEIRAKSPKDWTAEDTAFAKESAERALAIVEGEGVRDLSPDLVENITRDFKLGRVTEETARRPIRAEGPAGEQLALPAPELPGEGAGRGIDLAPAGATKPIGGKRAEISTRAAGKALGHEIRLDKGGGLYQKLTDKTQYNYTIQGGELDGLSFSIHKKGKKPPVKAEIVKAGSEQIKKWEKPKEKEARERMEESLTPSQVSSRLPTEGEVIPIERQPTKIGGKEVELKKLSLEEALEKTKPLIDEAQKYVEIGEGKPLELSRKVSEAYGLSNDPMFAEGLDKVTQAIAAKTRSISDAKRLRKTKRQADERRIEEEVRAEEGRKDLELEEPKEASRPATPEAVADEMTNILLERQKQIEAQKQFERDLREGFEGDKQAELDELIKEQKADLEGEVVREYGNRLADPDDAFLGEYDAVKAAKDVYELISGEEGAFSWNPADPKKIQAVHRLWRKAVDEGRKIGEYLKAAIPDITDSDIKRIEDFAAIHFAEKRAFETPRKTAGDYILEEGRARKLHGYTVQKIPYMRSWFDFWTSAEPFKFKVRNLGRYFTNPRVFFKKFPFLKEELYHPYRSAENRVSRRMKLVDRSLRNLKKGISRDSRRRIRDYAVLQQLYAKDPKTGEIVMERGNPVFKDPEYAKRFIKASNIEMIPKLSKVEMHVYDTLRNAFEAFEKTVNETRASIGENPFKKLDDYFTFLRAIKWYEKIGLKSEGFRPKDIDNIMTEYKRMKDTPFRFKHRRSRKAYTLEDDPFDIFRVYADAAIRYQEMSPIVAKVRRITDTVDNPTAAAISSKTSKILRDRYSPFEDQYMAQTADYLRQWGNKISGLPDAYAMAHPLATKRLQMLNRNIAAATLGANLRSYLVQLTALHNTYAEIGGYHTMRGVLDMMSPRANRGALARSEVLFGRNLDATIGEMLGDLRDLRVRDFPKVARTLAIKPLVLLDMVAARATWHGAFRKAKRMKLGEKDAITYADDVVTKTQASAAPGELAPIQYGPWGKTATMFQTFVINNWNFLVNDVFNFGPDVKVSTALGKMTRYVLGAAILNYVMEDKLGMKSPLPRPIHALSKGIANGNSGWDIAVDVSKEFLDPIPIVGNLRYGTSPLGPAAERIGQASELLDDKRSGIKAAELTGIALGVPGTVQTAKSIRAAKRGESPWGIAIGSYSEDDKGTRRSRRSRRPSR